MKSLTTTPSIESLMADTLKDLLAATLTLEDATALLHRMQLEGGSALHAAEVIARAADASRADTKQ